MPKAGISYDFTLEEHDETQRRGFMFARDRQGRRLFKRQDAETIRPRILSMGELTQSELPPELELTWFQEDWALGIGGINHRLDPKKLANAQRIDTSVTGLFRLARELRTTTVDSAPDSYEPSGFALAPDPTATNGLDPVLWGFVGRDVYTWNTTDTDWDIGTEPQAVDVFYKNGIQFGVNVVAPCWYGGTDVNESPYLYIYKEPTAADWTVSTITTTGGRCKYMAKGRNATDAEVLWGGFFVPDTGLNVSGAHNASTTTLTCSANPTGTIAVNDILLVGPAGTQETMLVTAVTNPDLTVVRGYGSTAQSHSDTEDIFLYQPHHVRSSTDPTNSGSWSAATAVGTDDQPITGVVFDGDNDILFVTKTDGIYSVNTDGTVRNLTPLFRQFGHTGNFIGAYAWNNHILLPMGYGGLLDLDFETLAIKDRSLKVVAPEETALHGVVLALHGDPVNLFAVIKDLTANTLYLMQANLIEFEGETEFRWHVLATMGAGAAITNNQTALMIDGSRSGRRRVWTGFTEASVNELPRFIPFGNVDDDSQDGFTNDANSRAETTLWDGNLPRVEKRFESIEIQSRNLSTTNARQILVEFQKDQDGNWIEAGTANTSPFQTVKFPSGTTAKDMQLRLTPSMTAIATTAPEMLSFRVKAQLRPEAVPVYDMQVYVADNMQILNGARVSKRTGDLKQLREWNETPVELLLYLPESSEFV